MKLSTLSSAIIFAATSIFTFTNVQAAEFTPKNAECIAPAKPGGGFDLTCKLIQSGIEDLKLLSKPLKISYLPGGVGAVAYNKMQGSSSSNGNLIVAFSSGSILNLSQGKFGKVNMDDVRWLGALGADYGIVAVKADSPLKNLADLNAKLEKDPQSVVFGAGATVGGQDWMQTAMLAQKLNIDVKKMRYVALEGGGEVATAALGGHVDVISGGLSETYPLVKAGKLRILAIFAPNRIEGIDIPTAKEQGYDVEWPVIRGYYVGKNVKDEQYNYWINILTTLNNNKEEIQKLREQYNLLPYFKVGKEFKEDLLKHYKVYEEISKEFGLVIAK